MVKEIIKRVAKVNRRTFDTFVKKFGRNDIVWISREKTYNSMGRATDEERDPVTISGDFQPVTFKDQELINIGWAEIGNAKLYVSYEYDIQLNDEIIVDSIRWRITQFAEQEHIGGSNVHKMFICKLI